MKTEFEIVFTPVNRDEIGELIQKAWWKCTKMNTLMKRVIFTNPQNPKNSYVRVRDEWWKITCTMKTVEEWDLHIESVKELEIQVDDFESMKNIFLWLWLHQKAYQETYREVWEINNEVEIMIDEWPWIKPFLEIEWKSESIVKKYVELLWFDYKDWIFWTVDQVYQKEQWFNPDYINTLSEITFENSPKKIQ